LQNPLHVAKFHDAGDQFIDYRRRGVPKLVEQMFDGIAGKQLIGVPADRFAQMQGQGIARIEPHWRRASLQRRPCRRFLMRYWL